MVESFGVVSRQYPHCIRGYFQRYALYKSTFYLLTYWLTDVDQVLYARCGSFQLERVLLIYPSEHQTVACPRTDQCVVR